MFLLSEPQFPNLKNRNDNDNTYVTEGSYNLFQQVACWFMHMSWGSKETIYVEIPTTLCIIQ